MPINSYTFKIIQKDGSTTSIIFEIIKRRGSPETHTIGGSYATDMTHYMLSRRVDSTDYRMRALGFRAFLAGRTPR